MHYGCLNAECCDEAASGASVANSSVLAFMSKRYKQCSNVLAFMSKRYKRYKRYTFLSKILEGLKGFLAVKDGISELHTAAVGF